MQDKITEGFIRHEINNIFTSISLNVEILKSIISKGEYDIDEIKSEVNAIKNGTEELIDISNSFTQNYQIIKERFNLFELVCDIKSEIIFSNKNKTKEIKVNIKKDFSLNQNRYLIKRILYNLIQNAYLYTDNESKILVQAYTINNSQYVQILDDGPGLPKSDLDKIFEVGYRINTKVKGTGLGLSIVKILVDKIGCQINIRNKKRSKGLLCELIIPALIN